MAVALSTCALAGFGAAAPAEAAGEACPGERLRPTAANAGAVDQATLCLIDRIRVSHRLPALRSNPKLIGVAGSQVSSMISHDYFADVRPSGQTPFALAAVTGYTAHAARVAVGQNIAWGVGSYSTARHIVAAWMHSPPHRANILTGAYRDAGVAVTPAVPGVLRAGRHGATYAMEFGVRRF